MIKTVIAVRITFISIGNDICGGVDVKRVGSKRLTATFGPTIIFRVAMS